MTKSGPQEWWETHTVQQRGGLIVAGVVLGVVVMWAVSDGSSSAPTGRRDGAEADARSAQSYVEEYGGEIGVIRSILAYDDCDTLADTFDAADSNHEAFGVGSDRSNAQLGRMTAALDRMEAIGCET